MKLFERILGLMEKGLIIIGGVCLFLLMVAVVADAGGRYFLNSPISGVYEISEFYLMIAIVFLGLSRTQSLKAHVRVELLLERLPVLIAKALNIFYFLATALVFGCIGYLAAKTGWNNIVLDRWTTGVVAIPTGPSWLIVALGCAVFTLRLVFDALCIIRPPNDQNRRPEEISATSTGEIST